MNWKFDALQNQAIRHNDLVFVCHLFGPRFANIYGEPRVGRVVAVYALFSDKWGRNNGSESRGAQRSLRRAFHEERVDGATIHKGRPTCTLDEVMGQRGSLAARVVRKDHLAQRSRSYGKAALWECELSDRVHHNRKAS